MLHYYLTPSIFDLCDPAYDQDSLVSKVENSNSNIHKQHDCFSNASPSLDVFEFSDQTVVTVELPGMSKADDSLSINYDPQTRHLKISGHLKRPTDFHPENAIKETRIGERKIGKFEKEVVVECNIDNENITAKLEDGMLTVVLPKKESKKICIQ
ncbi:Heat shock protein 16 [Neolecta irregularis DAH-3]|uniref:Heat shock protein 16 n=1 Tax=Neolecta irregularis (strain DAH-3) TaxID=1198029 RepID=A0A1U7LRX5_NEOID|nr:Heat shock protein 16 [Neolecta irregularis DAH-3]|eukprot:OLL25333.1 Heat shock protein 16 [Neolecta irregularis DAH-3]